MEKQMKVSIIVCTYNRPKLLKNALQSIITQTYKNLEIIIIDDGSTTNTKKIVTQLKDKRIKYYYKKNTGLFDSLNYGLKKVTGPYLCFCDDDDEFLPNKIEQQINFLKSHSNAVGCFSDFIIKQNKKNNIISLKNKKNNFIFHYISESFLPNNSIMLVTKAIKKIKFNITFSIGSDYDFLLQIAQKGEILYCPGEPVAIYTRHTNNMTNIQTIDFSVLISTIHYKKNKKSFSNVQRQSIESNILFREAKFLYWQKDYKKARTLFFFSLKKNPRNIKSGLFLLLTYCGENVFDKMIPFYEFFGNKIHVKDSA
jgi:glycosyltransferase involved in cell wall biosynthesis